MTSDDLANLEAAVSDVRGKAGQIQAAYTLLREQQEKVATAVYTMIEGAGRLDERGDQMVACANELRARADDMRKRADDAKSAMVRILNDTSKLPPLVLEISRNAVILEMIYRKEAQ